MSTPLATHSLILGLGISGLAMARWCSAQGHKVSVMDTRPNPPGLAKLAEVSNASFIPSNLSSESIQTWFADQESNGLGVRAIMRSPGLAPSRIAAVLELAADQGLWIANELTLFARELAALQQTTGYSPTVLAVTGTNGKTTVTALTAALLARAGKTVTVAGNIGPSLLDTLSTAVVADELPQVWVLELSSFQLDGAVGFSATAATVLNVTQDHLDWHATMDGYAQAKKVVYAGCGLRVVNRDDALVMSMVQDTGTTTAKRSKAREVPEVPTVSFGLSMPQKPGDYGLEYANGMTWLVRANVADETRKRRKSDEAELHVQRLMPADALRIRGRHNAGNALAALALASSTDASLASMLYGLREYRGEPHRVELIGVVNDVAYYDDSKGTNVGATVAAINGLGPDHGLLVILGGDGKGQDFSALTAPLAQYACLVVLIGQDANKIAAALAGLEIRTERATTLESAVKMCAAIARPGQAVLMSPACASLDMFDSYVHRAQVFVQVVAAIATDNGVTL